MKESSSQPLETGLQICSSSDLLGEAFIVDNADEDNMGTQRFLNRWAPSNIKLGHISLCAEKKSEYVT